MKISRLLCCLLLSNPFLPKANAEESEPAEAKASLFTSRREALTEATLVKLAPEARVKVTRKSKNLISYELRWPEALLILNVDENYEQAVQNKGMLGWISKFPKGERATPAAIKLGGFIPTISRTYGVVLPEGFDGGGQASSFLLSLSQELKGYAFTGSSFYDSSGYRIIGRPGDSPFFGRAGRNLLKLGPPVSPKELVLGKWEVTVTQSHEIDEAEMVVDFNSKDEFQADGNFLSVGNATVTISSGDGEVMARLGLDFVNKGTWTIKDDHLVIEDGGTTTSNLKADSPQHREMLGEVAKEIEEKSEPEHHWLICREKDLIILEEAESGFTATMKRSKP